MGNGNRFPWPPPGVLPPRPAGYLRVTMRNASRHLAVLAVLAVVLAGCGVPGTDELLDQARSEVESGLEGARERVESLTDDARFCLALTRAIAAIESGSPTTAQEAAEEVLAQAPEGVVSAAGQLVEELRRTLGSGAELDSEQLGATVEELLAAASELCDPRSGGG